MSRTQAVKRLLILSLILAMMTAGLTSCAVEGDKQSELLPGTITAETDETLTVVDQAGREVTVARNPKSIALCYRVVIRFLLSLDMGDKIAGIGKTEEFLEEIQPSLGECVDVGKGVADIEALAELNPDLFIHKASDIKTLDAVQNIGIPAIGIDVETPDDMVDALRVLGAVCGKEKKAETLIDYYQAEINRLAGLTKSIVDGDRHTAIVMGTSIGKVADGTMLQGEMLQTAGAINCADELAATELWPTAGTEQIFAWNPEYIFITGSEDARYNVTDIMSDDAWSELDAVKNEHVYVIPSDKDSWEFPGVTSLLGIEYMIHTMYPELLDEDELESKVEELYELMYGVNGEREYLGY